MNQTNKADVNVVFSASEDGFWVARLKVGDSSPKTIGAIALGLAQSYETKAVFEQLIKNAVQNEVHKFVSNLNPDWRVEFRKPGGLNLQDAEIMPLDKKPN